MEEDGGREDMFLFDNQRLTFDTLLANAVVQTQEEEEPPPKKAIHHVNEEGMFYCPVTHCRRVYRRKGDMVIHIRQKHTPKEQNAVRHLLPGPKSQRASKNFCCPIPSCPCGYVHERDLFRHWKAKHGDMAYMGEARQWKFYGEYWENVLV